VADAVTIAGYDNPRGYTLLATAKVSLQGPTGEFYLKEDGKSAIS